MAISVKLPVCGRARDASECADRPRMEGGLAGSSGGGNPMLWWGPSFRLLKEVKLVQGCAHNVCRVSLLRGNQMLPPQSEG